MPKLTPIPQMIAGPVILLLFVAPDDDYATNAKFDISGNFTSGPFIDETKSVFEIICVWSAWPKLDFY